jgi:hypothetical protein
LRSIQIFERARTGWPIQKFHPFRGIERAVQFEWRQPTGYYLDENRVSFAGSFPQTSPLRSWGYRLLPLFRVPPPPLIVHRGVAELR